MTKLIPRYLHGNPFLIDKSSIPGTSPLTSSTINYNWELRATNNESVKKAEQERALQLYLDRRGYISEDKDKRSYAQRDIDDKIAATQNTKTDFYQMGTPNAQSTDVTPAQVLFPALAAGTTFVNPLASMAYGAMFKPMEKYGVYLPVSLGLQKLGVNENAANIASYFTTDLGIGLAVPFAQKIGKTASFVNNQYRNLRIANELRKGIRNTELQPRVVKNSTHTRTRLGDVEIDDPNLMYHVDNGDYTGFSGNGAYVKDGMLFPSQHFNGQKPYTWWNLGRPYRNGQTRLLTTNKDNPSLLRVRDQDYPIGQWTGNPKDRTFVTNQEYVSSEPIRIGNEYKLDPNYGYRRIQEPIPTLEQAYQEAMIEKYPLALSHNILNDHLKSTLLGRHKSLLNPSTGLGHMKYNSEIDNHTTLIFGRDMLNNSHTPYLGDGDTPMIYEFFDDNEPISRYSVRKINQRMRNKSGIPLSKLGAGEQISLDDAIRIARENVAKGDNFNTYNELKFDGLIPVKKAGYGFTDSEEIADMLKRRGIITNFDFYTSNPSAYSNYEDFLKDVVFKNPNYKFRKGGKLK